MELPENADLLNALKSSDWELHHLPNIRETNDWNSVIGPTPQQLVRIKNILFPPAPVPAPAPQSKYCNAIKFIRRKYPNIIIN